ncbi:hypothetical protein [Rarobacter incanus]|uniref:Uncharacterized protein n=1 Tax=Rarobacter incanus TaxID=153494 RepID=A0A542SQH4_9MICO|nr:hypothetical protein [Rarobacter incanus]TQK76859.1 hypothetical protein FB389_1554 [Rarobacter incanus]
MPITLSTAELFSAFLEIVEASEQLPPILAEDVRFSFVSSVLESFRAEGLHGLQERGLIRVAATVELDPFLRAVLRTIRIADVRIDIRVEVTGRGIGASVPFLSAFGFDSGESMWTILRNSTDGLNGLHAAARDSALASINETVAAAFDGTDDGTALTVYVLKKMVGRTEALEVARGRTLRGDIEGVGTQSHFRPVGEAMMWDPQLLRASN